MDVLHQCPGMLCSFQKKIRIQWKLCFPAASGLWLPWAHLPLLSQGSSAPSPVWARLSSCTIPRKEQSAPKQGRDGSIPVSFQGLWIQFFLTMLRVALLKVSMPSWKPQPHKFAVFALEPREGFSPGRWAAEFQAMGHRGICSGLSFIPKYSRAEVCPLSSAAAGALGKSKFPQLREALGPPLFPVSRTSLLWHLELFVVSEVWDGWWGPELLPVLGHQTHPQDSGGAILELSWPWQLLVLSGGFLSPFFFVKFRL